MNEVGVIMGAYNNFEKTQTTFQIQKVGDYPQAIVQVRFSGGRF